MDRDKIAVDEIFFAALERTSDGERSACLDEMCGGDHEIRRRVERLLSARTNVDSFLEEPAPGIEVADYQDDTDLSGTQIGPYKLLERIGEGGMGTVYMAQQREPIKRRVALKLIKAGMDTRQVIARFEAERQALAVMDHPGIARVFDAGATESGRPYFVMELVGGTPITTFCDTQRLDLRQRLELFVQVCHAVQHAHQKGIIHRDLKPSNVIVAMYDDQPVSKVIDFGVAKATDEQLTEKTLFTRFGQMVGTLEYMSPEQTQLNQVDVDTRSDIYSLGVILYELLTGVPPFEKERIRNAAFDETLKMIREEEPTKPSTRLRDSVELPAIADNRRLAPAKLGSLLKGELDWIVMKSLEKDRARRYETANGFASDIQRYLDDEPVLACPPSTTYRLKKFLSRNRALVGTVAMIMALLLIGIAGTSWQAQRANSQRSRAEQAESQATARLDKALAAVDQMLTRVGEIKLENVPVATEVRRVLLIDALKFYDDFLQELPDDSRLRLETAMIQRRLARIHSQLGDVEKANESIGVAIDLLDRELADSPDNVRLQVEQARNHSTVSDFSEQDTKIEHLEKAVVILEGLLNTGQLDRDAHAELAYDSSLLAYSKRSTLEMSEAVKLFENAEAHFRVLLKEPSDNWLSRRQFAKHLQHFAHLLSHHGQLDAAEIKYREAIDVSKRLMEHEDRRVEDRRILASAFVNLAGASFRQQRHEEALEFYDQAIDLGRKLVRDFPSVPEYRLLLSGSLMSQAGNYSTMKDPEKGIACAEEAAALTQYLTETWPEVNKYHMIRGGTLNNVAMLMSEQNYELERAEQLALEAIDHQQQVLQSDPDQPTANAYLLNHYHILVQVRNQLGRHEDAWAARVEGEKLGVRLIEKYPDNKRIQDTLNSIRRMINKNKPQPNTNKGSNR